MTHHPRRPVRTCLLLLLVSLSYYPLAGQTLTAPKYRPRDAAMRATHMIDSIARLDAAAGAVRRLMVDTLTGGAIGLEFEPGAQGLALRAATPAAAAASFLVNHGPRVFGIGSGETALDLKAIHPSGEITHLRYQQTHAEYDVLGGQLTLHVARVPGGYTIQSANGWLVPDVAAPTAPNLSRRDAEVAALSVGSGRVRTPRDTRPVVVPHEEATRLAYLVTVFDSATEEAVVRYVDPQTGIVFGQTAADRSASPRAGSRTVKGERERSPLPRAEAPEPHPSTGNYELATGRAWTGETREFVVWFTGSVWQMADNSHAGTAEVIGRAHV